MGWLSKKGGGTSGTFARKSWKTRWFVLAGSVIKYYKEEVHFLAGGAKPLGMLQLDSDTVVKGDAKDHLAFSIGTTKRTMEFQAESAEIAGEWLGVLLSRINRLEL